jgi:hypothetical protein
MSSVYRTARGAILDMDRLKLANETTVAVGNNRVNARGDQLDENGNVVRPKDQIMSQHYKQGMGNVPTDMPIVESSSQAKKNRAQADVIDSQKLQETIEALTRQLAEKDAQLASSQPEVAADPIVQEEEEPVQQVDLSDEIDALLPKPQDATEPTADVPLRGGLASAIQKQKDYQESKTKSKRI